MPKLVVKEVWETPEERKERIAKKIRHCQTRLKSDPPEDPTLEFDIEDTEDVLDQALREAERASMRSSQILREAMKSVEDKTDEVREELHKRVTTRPTKPYPPDDA